MFKLSCQDALRMHVCQLLDFLWTQKTQFKGSVTEIQQNMHLRQKASNVGAQ